MNEIKQLSILITEMSEKFRHIYESELTKHGLSYSSALVLGLVKDSPKTIGELSKLTELPYSTMSGIINRLEQNELVSRRKDEQDRRIVWVSLADDERVLEQRLSFMKDQFLTDVFADLPQQELSQICQSLQLLNEYLDKKILEWRERK